MSLSDSIVGILKRIKGDVSKRDTNARELSALTVREKLDAILAEISETVLPRALTFEIADQASLAMDIGGRRVLRVIGVSPETLNTSGDIALLARDETMLDKQIAAISELLAAFVNFEGPLTVTSGKPGAEYSANEVGFTEQELREACAKLDLPDEKPATRKKPAKAKTKAAATPAKSKPASKAAKPKPAAKSSTADTKKKPAAKAKPAAKPRKKVASNAGKSIQTFMDANKAICTGIAVISPDGKLKSAVGATGKNPDWAGIAKDISDDVGKWSAGMKGLLGTEQMIILKSPGISNQSICFLHLDGHIVAAIFSNSDLARIMSSVNQILYSSDTS